MNRSEQQTALHCFHFKLDHSDEWPIWPLVEELIAGLHKHSKPVQVVFILVQQKIHGEPTLRHDEWRADERNATTDAPYWEERDKGEYKSAENEDEKEEREVFSISLLNGIDRKSGHA